MVPAKGFNREGVTDEGDGCAKEGKEGSHGALRGN